MVRDYSTWDIVTTTPALILEALDVERRQEVPFWDALILETAKRAGVSVLYSENLAKMQRYGAIQIVNRSLIKWPTDRGMIVSPGMSNAKARRPNIHSHVEFVQTSRTSLERVLQADGQLSRSHAFKGSLER